MAVVVVVQAAVPVTPEVASVSPFAKPLIVAVRVGSAGAVGAALVVGRDGQTVFAHGEELLTYVIVYLERPDLIIQASARSNKGFP